MKNKLTTPKPKSSNPLYGIKAKKAHMNFNLRNDPHNKYEVEIKLINYKLIN